MRGLFLAVCLVLSGVATYYGRPLVEHNTDAITIIVTVITVFAGFLVAIIAVLGDPAIVPTGSWIKAEIAHGNLENAVARHISLFYVYLMAIGLLFAGVLIDKEPDCVVGPRIKHFVEGAYLFFGVLSFLLTLSLPQALGKLQVSRSNAEVDRRRADAGITDEENL